MQYQTYVKLCSCPNVGIINFGGKTVCRWCRKPFEAAGMINYTEEQMKAGISRNEAEQWAWEDQRIDTLRQAIAAYEKLKMTDRASKDLVNNWKCELNELQDRRDRRVPNDVKIQYERNAGSYVSMEKRVENLESLEVLLDIKDQHVKDYLEPTAIWDKKIMELKRWLHNDYIHSPGLPTWYIRRFGKAFMRKSMRIGIDFGKIPGASVMCMVPVPKYPKGSIEPSGHMLDAMDYFIQATMFGGYKKQNPENKKDDLPFILKQVKGFADGKSREGWTAVMDTKSDNEVVVTFKRQILRLRYNTEAKTAEGDRNIWRVIREDWSEKLAESVEIKVPVFTTYDKLPDGRHKAHISMYYTHLQWNEGKLIVS